jgi:hypothetical protein
MTNKLSWASSTVLLNISEYEQFKKTNRFKGLVDYSIFNAEHCEGLWTVKFNENISLTRFNMMINKN